MIAGVVAFILIFIACELGQRMTDAFDEISLEIDQFNWYLFPRDLQRTLLTIIPIAQQPVLLECFGNKDCTRETFKSVSFKKLSLYWNNDHEFPKFILLNFIQIINTTYSYFMTLREFSG